MLIEEVEPMTKTYNNFLNNNILLFNKKSAHGGSRTLDKDV